MTEADVHRGVGELLAIDEPTVDAFMADLWTEYLGSLNTELAAYLQRLKG